MTFYDEKPLSLDSIAELEEGNTIEAKAAQGRDGRGELPGSIWETYSAFANTSGGWIILGVVEEGEEQRLVPVGVKDPRRLMKSVWDSVNNAQVVSANVLQPQNVYELEESGCKVVVIYVPAAARQKRPVYIKNDIMQGTYKRNFEGDYRCTESEVRQMVAESSEQSRDAAILDRFGIEDLEQETIRAFRGMVGARNPDHVALQGDDVHLLKQLGAIQQDRRRNELVVTRGGLLLFGKYSSLLEAFPGMFLDYRERRDEPDAPRWDDRIFSDGTWSGNVIDFYRKVYPKLVSDLKVPFQLDAYGRRIDETLVHKALREALANTLSNADYHASTPVVILKKPGRFIFTNPGRLRLPLKKILQGGVSDPRNGVIHRAFIWLGIAERAGSGIPTILHAWQKQHWQTPVFEERFEPEQTVFLLSTASLLPEEAVAHLRQRFGAEFEGLSVEGRVVLVTAYLEESVTHARLRNLLHLIHSRDLTMLLQSMVRQGLLRKEGTGRHLTYYFVEQEQDIAGERGDGQLSLSDAFYADSKGKEGSSDDSAENFQYRAENSQHSAVSSDDSAVSSDDSAVSSDDWKILQKIAAPVASKKRVDPVFMKETIVKLCQVKPLSLQELASLLERQDVNLRIQYLSKMVKAGEIFLLHSKSRTHPRQAYYAKNEG